MIAVQKQIVRRSRMGALLDVAQCHRSSWESCSGGSNQSLIDVGGNLQRECSMRLLAYTTALLALAHTMTATSADCRSRLIMLETSIGAGGGLSSSSASSSNSASGTGSTGTTSGSSSADSNMGSARAHLDAARSALAARNEKDCMSALDQAARAARVSE